MFHALGRFVARHPWGICAAWLLAGAVVTLSAPKWESKVQDDDIRFLPARCDSVRGYRLLEQAFPQDVAASRLLFTVERTEAPLDTNDFARVDEIVADLDQLRQAEPALRINRIVSFRDPFVGARLNSADGHCTLIQVALGTPYLAVQTQATVDRAETVVRARLKTSGAGAPLLYTTGPAGIGRDLVKASASSLDRTTIATVVLVIVILLAVYRAPLVALVPLLTIMVSVWLTLKVLALCTLIPGFYLVNISQIFAVVMLYGAGTDYCLFLISSYREELGRGLAGPEALARSVGSVGGALAASAATVICGLGMMGFAEFAKVRSGGPAIAIGLAVALAASLTLAPALLRLCGSALFWPKKLSGPRPAAIPNTFCTRGGGIWGRLSKLVVTRPVAVWCTCVVLLLPLAWLGLTVKANYRATGELSPTSSSVRGLAVIQKHFTAGEVGPVTVLLESAADWDSPRGRRVLDQLTRGFGYLDNVAEVRSLTQPLGPAAGVPGSRSEVRCAKVDVWASESPGTGSMFGSLLSGNSTDLLNGLSQLVEGPAHQAAKAVYEAKIATPAGERFVTRLDVVLKTDPFDPRSLPALEMIQSWLRDRLPGDAREFGAVRAETFGVTVNARDLAQVTEKDRTRINALVLAGIFVILLLVVRRPWLAGYLLVTVLFSYYATLGATTLMAHCCHARPLGEVDWRVPFFLFTILVAVGEDYNILLMTRALEECRQRGVDRGMWRALARTGGTITSCGVIMAGTFATLMLAGLNTLVQIGFALAFGVLLDTFVVRPFLVPALTLWVWRKRVNCSPAPLSSPSGGGPAATSCAPPGWGG